MEGDAPSFLGVDRQRAERVSAADWGGWGGRYVYRQPYGETHAIWTQGGDEFARVDSRDTVVGLDGKEHVSDQATIWRWREAFQNDFAARMTWTVADFAHANHNPAVVVNGQGGTAPLEMDVRVGETVSLDAGKGSDPDGRALHSLVPLRRGWNCRWEFGSSDAHGRGLRASHGARRSGVPAAVAAADSLQGDGIAHVILAVTDEVRHGLRRIGASFCTRAWEGGRSVDRDESKTIYFCSVDMGMALKVWPYERSSEVLVVRA